MQYSLPANEAQLRLHRDRWCNCQRCPLQANRRNVVLWRGYVPCEILFIGEAPGLNEDRDALPFVGESGVMLDTLLHDTLIEMGGTEVFPLPIICITNAVCCLPIGERNKTREPTKEEIKACNPRLTEFIDIARPKVIVAVGKVASDNFKVHYSIEHPASMLRLESHQFPAVYLDAITTLIQAFGACR